MDNAYLWVKALHIIFVASWFAGLFYLPRLFVNLAMVAAGFAWHYKQYASEQSASDRLLYDRAERDSRQARRGLWRDPDPTAPWDWRKASRKGKHLTDVQPHESNRASYSHSRP